MRGSSRIVLKSIAACYRAAYLLHHKFFLKPDKSLPTRLGSTRLVVIGGYRTGGAGKTPFCQWLAQHLAQKFQGSQPAGHGQIVILCHSYAYDEIRMLQDFFSGDSHTIPPGFIEIVGTRNRHRSILQLLQRKTPPMYILCDDGFEDSRLAGAVNIILHWDDPSELWPLGRCRSLPDDHVHDENTIDLICGKDVDFSIRHIKNCKGENLQSSMGRFHGVRVLCGIGDPQRLLRDIASLGISVGENLCLRDHDHKFQEQLSYLLEAYPDDAIIMTQKDLYKLSAEQRIHGNIFTVYQKTSVANSAIDKIDLALVQP